MDDNQFTIQLKDYLNDVLKQESALFSLKNIKDDLELRISEIGADNPFDNEHRRAQIDFDRKQENYENLSNAYSVSIGVFKDLKMRYDILNGFQELFDYAKYHYESLVSPYIGDLLKDIPSMAAEINADRFNENRSLRNRHPSNRISRNRHSPKEILEGPNLLFRDFKKYEKAYNNLDTWDYFFYEHEYLTYKKEYENLLSVRRIARAELDTHVADIQRLIAPRINNFYSTTNEYLQTKFKELYSQIARFIDVRNAYCRPYRNIKSPLTSDLIGRSFGEFSLEIYHNMCRHPDYFKMLGSSDYQLAKLLGVEKFHNEDFWDKDKLTHAISTASYLLDNISILNTAYNRDVIIKLTYSNDSNDIHISYSGLIFDLESLFSKMDGSFSSIIDSAKNDFYRAEKYLNQQNQNKGLLHARNLAQSAKQSIADICKANQIRIDCDNQMKKNLLADLDDITRLSAQIQEILTQLYNMGIIKTNYRHLTAITFLYEYIDDGITNRLDGSAHKMCREDVRYVKLFERMDIIILSLNEINAHLAAIEENQYTLYRVIQKSYSVLEGISNQLDKIRSEIAAGINKSSRNTDAITNEIRNNTEQHLNTSSTVNRIFHEIPYFAEVAKENLRIQNLSLETHRNRMGHLLDRDGFRIQ